jgi:hypothetical protein
MRLSALIPLLVLAGCSAFSLAWNYVDGVLADQMDEWVALDPPQRAELDQRLQSWLDTIAVERLPEYTEFVRAAGRRTRSGLTGADAEWMYRGARTRYRALVAGAVDAWIAPTLVSIDRAQMRHLGARMQSENAAYRARYLDVPRHESQRALAARIVEFIEGWTGPLSVQQTELLYREVRALPDTSRQWYQYRVRMQAGLLTLLHRGADEARVAAWMRGWWAERARLNPDDRAAFDDFEDELIDLLGTFARTLTPAQRLSIGRRLRGIADQLEAIHFQSIRG